VGVAAADFASKKAAATATGLTGTFGYLGSTVCGVGTGLIVDKWGWDGGFMFFIASAILGTLFFLLTWNHRSKTLDNCHVT
ncbi:MFS transporter, partial [bacterium]|nr:MFS transporter [bacterium]